MNQIIEQLSSKFQDHATKVFPEEACGLVILKDNYACYVECTNVCDGNKLLDFEIAEEEADKHEGNILAVFHSHTNGNKKLTPSDISFSEATRTPYIMYCVQSSTFDWYIPKGNSPFLLGREYVGGSHDCYGLVKDYYLQELGIILPDFYREDLWWKKDKDYLNSESFSKAGFISVYPDDIKKNDVVVMKFSDVMDHLGIYLGENLFLHHAYKRLSKKEFFGGSWKKAWVQTLRHRSLK